MSCVHIALKPFKYLNFQSNHLGTHKTPPLFKYKKTLNKRSNSSHVKNLELTALDTQNKQILKNCIVFLHVFVRREEKQNVIVFANNILKFWEETPKTPNHCLNGSLSFFLLF